MTNPLGVALIHGLDQEAQDEAARDDGAEEPRLPDPSVTDTETADVTAVDAARHRGPRPPLRQRLMPGAASSPVPAPAA